MIKTWLISFIVKLITLSATLGIGIWYLSSAIGGTSLSYTSIDLFLKQIGVQNGDISSAQGCFLCHYLEELFDILGRAIEMFWNGLLNNLWIVMAIGFGIFIIVHTVKQLHEQAASKDVQNVTKAEPKLDFKKWFEKVWKTGLRLLIAGALLGAINMSGTKTLQTLTKVTVGPVMYIGTWMSMTTTKLVSNATCSFATVDNKDIKQDKDILNPVLRPFMCVMGNLNSVMLAGVGGGFALMNYSWLDMGGGFFTWLAGLALVIAFLIIGFDLVFQVLNVIFKLVFIIIFMPLFVASYAFEDAWKLANGLISKVIDILVNSAVDILRISLKVCIVYALAYFSADQFYPGPTDGFTTIMPPLLNKTAIEKITNIKISKKAITDTQEMSVMKVFAKCESVSVTDGKMDKDKFITCFNEQRQIITKKYPKAFDFMEDGFDFFIFMIGIGLLYFWVISPKIDALIGETGKDKLKFDFGAWVKDIWKMIYSFPSKLVGMIRGK